MMKKMLATLLIAVLLLGAAALAETYTHDDLTFDYDGALMEIAYEDHTDDEDTVILNFKDDALAGTCLRVYLRDLEDGEAFPTMDDFTAMPDASDVTQGDWAGFTNVFSYNVVNEEGIDSFFIAPVYDDDGREVEDLLTVEIFVTNGVDDELAMTRDDAISAVVDSLKVLDD